jgi:hypothetical protein
MFADAGKIVGAATIAFNIVSINNYFYFVGIRALNNACKNNTTFSTLSTAPDL